MTIAQKVTVTTFSYSSATIDKGKTSGTPTKTIIGTAKSGPTYSSSNTSIATVNSSTGVVTGVSAGTATITISYTNYDGSTSTKTCNITIKATSVQLTTTKITGATQSGYGIYTLTTTLPISKVEDAYDSSVNSLSKGNGYNGRFSSHSGQTIYHATSTGAIDKITYTDGSYEYVGFVDRC